MADTLNAAGVEFRPFLTATTSLDGSIATTYQTGAQVAVCDNTLSATHATACPSLSRSETPSSPRNGLRRGSYSRVKGLARQEPGGLAGCRPRCSCC